MGIVVEGLSFFSNFRMLEMRLVFLLLISSSLILSASAEEEPCMRANRCLNLLVQRRLLSRYQPFYPAPTP
jgi:hypothetical protein